MEINKDSSVGVVEDLITNIMQLVASEYHLSILVRKYEDMIKYWYYDGTPELQSTDDVKNIEELEEKLKDIQDVLYMTTQERRNAMKRLKGYSTDKGNHDYWCLLKHVLGALITSFEVWQVDLSDEVNKGIFIEQSRIVNKVIALFLGYEVTPCSACLSDMMK